MNRCIRCSKRIWPFSDERCQLNDGRWVCSRRCWEDEAWLVGMKEATERIEEITEQVLTRTVIEQTHAAMKARKEDRKKLQAFGRVKNIAPSRETANDLRRIALLLRAQSGMGTYDEDANMLDEVAETLLDIRQAVRGGSREKQERNWHEDG